MGFNEMKGGFIVANDVSHPLESYVHMLTSFREVLSYGGLMGSFNANVDDCCITL